MTMATILAVLALACALSAWALGRIAADEHDPKRQL